MLPLKASAKHKKCSRKVTLLNASGDFLTYFLIGLG